MRTSRFATSLWSVVVPFVLSCGAPDVQPKQQPQQASASVTPYTIAELDTFIANSIQIDQLSGGPGDANLYTGLDPADSTLSANLPAGGPGSYIDWQNLYGTIANHRVLDTDDATTGTDLTAFPGSNSCVGPANVLSKMDLTYVGVASNTQYVYLAVQRAANNGDAGYYWLFTKKTPHMVAGASPCSASQQLLSYDISGPNASTGAQGDVLIAGHFKPSAGPLLRVFQATRDENGVVAEAAINYSSTLWSEDASGVAAIAVNTTPTAPGGWGSAGVKSMQGANLGPELFAEAAVPLSVFTGGSSCGSNYYGSVITRSSGSGGTSPDLKDLAGPTQYDFGGINATAALTPSCTLDAGFSVTSAKDQDGDDIVSPTCSWSFDDGGSSTSCSGTHAFAAAGSHHGSVTVTDPASGCSVTVTTANINAYTPLGVTPAMTGGCASQFGYSSSVSGGSGGVSYAWSFSGPGTPSPASSTSASGSASITVGGTYNGHLVVTDSRSDGPTCTASGDASAVAWTPLVVSLTRGTEVLTCETGLSTDAVTYSAVASGGDGNYVYAWSGVTCAGSSCTVNPDDSNLCVGPINFHVGLTDGSGSCAGATSENESYQKVTVITATDN